MARDRVRALLATSAPYLTPIHFLRIQAYARVSLQEHPCISSSDKTLALEAKQRYPPILTDQPSSTRV